MGEDGKGEWKVVPQALLKFETTPNICLFHKFWVRNYKKTGKSVLPGRAAPSWGCWGCVEGAVHEVMVVTQVGPEKEREIEILH